MIKFLKDQPKKNLRGVAILRLDFNTEDEWRMEAALPTIKYLKKTARSIIILSHRGRPKGFKKSESLKKDVKALSKFLDHKVKFIPHFKFEEIRHEISCAAKGSIFLLENLRFLPGEGENDSKLGRQLSSLGDYYVNEAFSVSHRAHASVSSITSFLPSYAGINFQKEIIILCAVMSKPKKPLILIIGGAKASDKLGILNYFKNKADKILLGGSPAITILNLKGELTDASLMERNIKSRKKLRKFIKLKNIVLPFGFYKKNGNILDINKETAEFYSKIINNAGTIIWNGPLGYFENPKFAKGSIAIARAIIKNKKSFSIVGGGETVALIKKYGFIKKFGFISTGGGAMLDFLAGEKLPGIIALKKNDKKT